ncbi:MAG: sugar-phosphatase [Clostridiaceae bacterium]
MYKIIAVDMDGTLLREDKSVSERTKKAIAKAKESGVKVVIATGRPIEGIDRYLEDLNLVSEHDYALSYNGALVLNTETREVISSTLLYGRDAHDLYDLSKELGVNIHAFSRKHGLVTPKNSKYTEVEATINNIDINVMPFSELHKDDEVIKVMMIDEPEILETAIAKLPEELYEKYTVVRSTPYFLEFMNKEVNKGTGVETLAKHLDVDKSEVICVGDAGNDYHMVQYAGLGVAMGNATEELKEIAEYITATNQEDGVAEVIEKFILK